MIFKRNLTVIFILSFIFPMLAQAQEDRFLSDISAMKIGLCFKDFIVADSNTNPGSMLHAISSHKVFMNPDSSLIVLIMITNTGFNRNRLQPTDDPITQSISRGTKEEQARIKKNRKIAQKIGARYVLAGEPTNVSSDRFPGYSQIWGVSAFGERGVFMVTIHQKVDAYKKMSERTLINFTSNFIRYNN